MAEKFVFYPQLSELTGLSVRTLRTLVYRKAIPCVRLGHRIVVFSPSKVEKALSRYEIKEIGR